MRDILANKLFCFPELQDSPACDCFTAPELPGSHLLSNQKAEGFPFLIGLNNSFDVIM